MINSQLENRKLILNKYNENSGMPQCQIAKSLKIPRFTVQNVLSNLFKTKSIERLAGSGRKTGAADKNIENKILNAFHTYPNMSVRLVANKIGTSAFTVHRTKDRNSLKTYKVQKVPDREQVK